jgi:hypothetical protein
MNKLVALVYILSFLLLLSFGYVAYDAYSTIMNNAYIAGGQEGYDAAIGQIFQQTKDCQQVPLTVQNETINLVTIECLQQAQQQAQPQAQPGLE